MLANRDSLAVGVYSEHRSIRASIKSSFPGENSIDDEWDSFMRILHVYHSMEPMIHSRAFLEGPSIFLVLSSYAGPLSNDLSAINGNHISPDIHRSGSVVGVSK